MIVVNGTDLSTLGVLFRQRSFPSLGGERSALVPIPGRSGGVRMGGSVEPGSLSVEGHWYETDHETARRRLDSLAALLQGENVVRFTDYPDREWVGHFQQAPNRAQFLDPQWISAGGRLTLEWALPDPTARAQAETSVSGAAPALALGTAPSALTVQVTNGATAAITRVVVDVRAGTTVLRSLDWSGSLALSATLLIDAGRSQVRIGTANAVQGITSASVFPVADPAAGADNVAVAVTGGGGHSITTRYRRRWW